MTAIEPSGQILGATVRGMDLAKPLGDADFATILEGLGRHGVLRFPGQKLEAVQLRDFSRRFGQIQATLTGRHHEPGMPEVGYLSNIIENGEPIGITDAGQDWHTDMSYNETIGFLNVLYAVKVPRRDGQVLGATMFANTQAAYEDLAPELKARLANARATHDFNKFWENIRRSSDGVARRPSIRCFSRIRSRVGACSTATPATRSASTSSTRPRAIGCSRPCSRTSSSRSISSRTAGPKETC
jgi:alpha-ketoglutarate-dependent taurine dioxygenase